MPDRARRSESGVRENLYFPTTWSLRGTKQSCIGLLEQKVVVLSRRGDAIMRLYQNDFPVWGYTKENRPDGCW